MTADETLTRRFFEHVVSDDVEGRDRDTLHAMSRSTRDLAATRSTDEAVVRVVNPTADEHGWTGRHTVVQACAADMPFLVDSVLGELTRRELTAHLLIHPQMVVRRGAEGLVVTSTDPADAPEGARVESWIYVEIDRIPGADAREDLRRALVRVLDDVRKACADWRAMRQKCLDIVAELREGPPETVDPDTVEPTLEFLTWLEDNHFTFLGYREYELTEEEGERKLRSIPSTGLGILRSESDEPSVTNLEQRAQRTARQARLLSITKANSRSTVHRPVYLDYVGVRRFDESGHVVAERRFLGLFTASAYAESVQRLPIIGGKVQRILDGSGFAPDSHSGKDLLGVLEAYPRDELFQASVDELSETAYEVLHLQERRRSRLFVRADEFGRFVSALLYIPKDRYTTTVRLRMQELLKQAYGTDSVDYSARVGESVLAQLHFVVRMPKGTPIPQVDTDDLQDRLIEATRSWGERLGQIVEEQFDGDPTAGDALAHYVEAFPESYKEDFDAVDAFGDLTRLAELDADESVVQLRPYLYAAPGGAQEERRLKLYRRQELSLTDVLPVCADLGVEVTDERPYELAGSDGSTWVYDFGLRASSGESWLEPGSEDIVAALFEDAFAAVWEGQAESDSLNELVLTAGLTWRQVVVLRTHLRYLRQVSSSSLSYLQEALVANPEISAMIVELFAARFDPDADDSVRQDRDSAGQDVVDRIEQALDSVSSLDQDRIIRFLLRVVNATVRTNFYQRDGDGEPKSRVSLKLLPRRIDALPEPRPAFEIWVYAPTVEGVHLRFGSVARGGLRWSDRREDFRTEILGLVKAQLVKNAVIVPTGSKGGFVAKQLPDPSVDREAYQAEGVAAYTTFISGMLDVTDNRDGTTVLPPERVVRHDGDDPYLVVAADKGTATFSDIANGVSRDYGFWLDDAFASGGSAGYDHKAMGITARGAWESVKRHFRELGVDTQSQEFTVVGVGDMSGDVFGNGMLLSEHIKLVAAFDHRHIFLDPEPDPAASFAERQRLFELPRSSWADYDTSLISDGGGVHSRTAKSVVISQQVRGVLGLEAEVESLTPAELLKAILLAPVDLFWNGGIGTYVKASTELHTDIGDRANDNIRVDGRDLRVRVVGEGGNLGLSQLGRIEAARSGVHVNTDAVDNSAGVDTSDHEVNIKIALTPLVGRGELTMEQRDELLAEMTDEVAQQVLRHNYEQNVLIGNARDQGGRMVSVHGRLMRHLTEHVGLDPELEFLPDSSELSRRQRAGHGLSSPEFSVMMAYAKLGLKEDLLDSELPDEPAVTPLLVTYFPEPLRKRISDELAEHPLRRQIVINQVANDIVNRGGVTFVFRAMEETGANSTQIARAFVVCRAVFDMAGYIAQVEQLDNEVDTDVQTELYLEFRRLLDRAVRWFLNNRPLSANLTTEIERFSEPVQTHSPQLVRLLQGEERDRHLGYVQQMCDKGVPRDLSSRWAGLLDTFSLLDVVEVAADAEREVAETAQVYFAVSEAFGIDALLTQVSHLPRADRWSSLARGAVRDDMYGVMRALTRAVMLATDPEQEPLERVHDWMTQQSEALARVSQVLNRVSEMDEPGLAPVSVALRTLRGLVRQGTAE
ncbi:MAG TPA: NAD-glutamate dehydrogenase [Ornithinimicrobium sp.]|uniref:NAD-glutamate dehydrogenase n=1 Tax=Ornithinimicrobium sp. TaxID=1977084 RepID=UPI002B45EFF1|nr:NAD-glutamate dehydrogenase [Ornithinimicrobium sp.]HKJ12584.1 NAD-glutamate dehydrogenase [Ornithinimicrobium sp.]